MSGIMIKCPHCDKSFEITDAVSHQMEEELKHKFEAEITKIKADDKAESEKKIKEAEKALSDKLQKEHEEKKSIFEKEALEKAKKLQADELKVKDEMLAESEKKLKEARDKELEYAKMKSQFEEKTHCMELENIEKTNKLIEETRKKALEEADKENQMKLAEKEKTISDLNKKMQESQRIAQQGSMQTQGEVQELDIEEQLRLSFVHDIVDPVGKGVKGGDIKQTVCFDNGKKAGMILWESKRTKAWSAGWVEKLKEDQRAAGAELAVIISEVLPAEIKSFGRVDGIWVADMKYLQPLAYVLRESLKAVSLAKSASEGKSGKIEMIYTYLTGTQFVHRIEEFVECFTSMNEDLFNEKKAMEKAWGKREKQIERFEQNMGGFYGDLQGLGAVLPNIKAFELPGQDELLKIE